MTQLVSFIECHVRLSFCCRHISEEIYDLNRPYSILSNTRKNSNMYMSYQTQQIPNKKKKAHLSKSIGHSSVTSPPAQWMNCGAKIARLPQSPSMHHLPRTQTPDNPDHVPIMWHHFINPSEVLVSSDARLSNNFTFCNVFNPTGFLIM